MVTPLVTTWRDGPAFDPAHGRANFPFAKALSNRNGGISTVLLFFCHDFL